MQRLTGRLAVAMLGVMLAMAAAACGGASARPPASTPAASPPRHAPATAAAGGGLLAQLSAQTKGKAIVFDSAVRQSEMGPVLAAFKSAYPGTAVKYANVTAEQLDPMIVAQEAAHNVQVDLAFAIDTSDVPRLLQAKAMAPVPSKGLGIPADDVFMSRWVHLGDLPGVIGYNTHKVKPSEVPGTWNDLLRSRWGHGHIAIDARGHFLQALVFDPHQGLQAALAFAARLKAQSPLAESRMSSVEQAVISGEADLGTMSMTDILDAQKRGAPLGMAPVSPQMAPGEGFYIPVGAPNAAGAELLLAWLASTAGRAAMLHSGAMYAATPCGASPAAGMLCQQHIVVEHANTLGRMKRAIAALTPLEKALGTYK